MRREKKTKKKISKKENLRRVRNTLGKGKLFK